MGNTMIRFPMKVPPSLRKNCNRVRAYGFSDYLRACHRRAASADARRATAGAELGAAVAHIAGEAAAVAAVAHNAAEAAAVAEAAVAEAARIPGGVAEAVVGPRSAPSSSPAARFALDS